MNKFFTHVLLILIVFVLGCHQKNDYEIGDIILGEVIKILDGDTYDLLCKNKKTIRIRMEGIDAPEKGMPFYRVSKSYLGEICSNREIKVLKTNEDRYGRTIGYSYLDDGRELSKEMIKAGLAWHYKQYNSDEELSNFEIEAQKAKNGLWIHDNPMPPWENRKLHRKGISTKDLFDIKEGVE